MIVQPYLSFEGRCEEALTFYRNAVGAEIDMLMRYKDSPEPHPPGMLPEGSDDKIMHCSFRIGESVIMASDGNCSGSPQFQGMSLSLSVADEAEGQRVFSALSEGGRVEMPLTKTFFSPGFGIASDPFGVTWMVVVAA